LSRLGKYFLCSKRHRSLFVQDELMAELEELEQEEFDEEVLKIPSAELPDVPTTALPAKPAGLFCLSNAHTMLTYRRNRLNVYREIASESVLLHLTRIANLKH